MFVKGFKISTSFVGPFDILEKIGPIAYHLYLIVVLQNMHNVFHVYVLRKYISYASHIFDWKQSNHL